MSQTLTCPQCGDRPLREFVTVSTATIANQVTGLVDGVLVIDEDESVESDGNYRLIHSYRAEPLAAACGAQCAPDAWADVLGYQDLSLEQQETYLRQQDEEWAQELSS